MPAGTRRWPMGNAYYDQVAEWSALTPYQREGLPDPEQMLRQQQLHRPALPVL